MREINSGQIESKDQVRQLITGLAKDGIRIVLPDAVGMEVTDWWVLDHPEGRVLYIGTAETYARWRSSMERIIDERQREGLVVEDVPDVS